MRHQGSILTRGHVGAIFVVLEGSIVHQNYVEFHDLQRKQIKPNFLIKNSPGEAG